MPGPAKPFTHGNPGGGRAKKTSAMRAAEAWAMSLELDGKEQENRPLAVLRQLYADATGAEKPSERTAAGREFLDRVYGKAPQAIVGADGAPLLPAFDVGRLSDADLGSILRLARAAFVGPASAGGDGGAAPGGGDGDGAEASGEVPPVAR